MNNISLQKYSEMLISELEKRLGIQRKSDRKQLFLIIKYQSKALKLQAVEYERRLQVLNNDRAEAREKEITFSSQNDFLELKDRVNSELSQRAGVSKALVAYLTFASTMALVIGSGVAIMTYLKI